MGEHIIKSYFFKDELSISKIVEDYYSYIAKIATNMGIFNEEDKEEIVSDVIFVIWKNKDKLNKELDFSPYIAGVTKNIVYKKLKKENKISTVDFEEYDYISNFNISDAVEEKEINDFILRTLEQNSPIDSKIFEMFYLEDKSIGQISKITGISKNNVKVKLHRIRKKIKEILKLGGFQS